MAGLDQRVSQLKAGRLVAGRARVIVVVVAVVSIILDTLLAFIGAAVLVTSPREHRADAKASFLNAAECPAILQLFRGIASAGRR